MGARFIAYKILYKVLYEKAYSNIALNQALNNCDLDNRNKGFVTEIVYGTISKKIFLEHILKKFLTKPLSKLDKSLRVIFLMGIYQIGFMDSVTDFAVVDESVKLCKKVMPAKSGFVNAVLRNILRDEKSFEINIPKKRNIEYLSVKYSLSEDIVRLIISQYGDDSIRIFECLNDKPKLFIRANSLKTDADTLKAKLNELNIDCEISEDEPYALRVKGLKSIGDIPEFRSGLFSVQDTSSMKVVRVLNPMPNENILDICAAPGGKSAFIAELMQNKGTVVSQDISSNKLALIDNACKRLGIEIVKTKTWDATEFNDEYINKFDRVLVDAPCSGTGIIPKKPEIRYKNYEEIKALYDTQEIILENASKYVKDDGILVYSTCTINKEENENQIQKFLKKSDFCLVEEINMLFGENESDGFYIAKLQRRRQNG